VNGRRLRCDSTGRDRSRVRGYVGVQHRSTRSNDRETVAFVVMLFGLLLVLALAFGSAPIV